MEYKEKYKNVMEVLKKAASDPEWEDERFCCVVYDLFPELKESEDESILEIIKHCIESRYLHTSTIKGISQKQCFTWLEKQGEQKPIDKIQLGKKYKCIASPRYSTFRRGNIYKPVDNFLCNLMNLCYECFEPIEDSEQKPADKVEPKFNQGDWVIDKQGIVHQIANVIENVTNHTYGYDIVGGGYFNDNTEGVKLWTIQDAKDGDVLVASDDSIFIYAGSTDRHAQFYIALSKYGGFNTKGGNWEDKNRIKPATKEQRDTLIKAMTDAGYTFDFEKKELKKISQRMVSAEAKEALYDKPAWSEEDE